MWSDCFKDREYVVRDIILELNDCISTLVIMLQIPHQRLLLETDSPDALPQVDKPWLQKDLLAKRCEIEECGDVHCVERQHHSHLHKYFNKSCEDGNPSAMLMLNRPAKIVAVSIFLPGVICTPAQFCGYQMTLSKYANYRK